MVLLRSVAGSISGSLLLGTVCRAVYSYIYTHTKEYDTAEESFSINNGSYQGDHMDAESSSINDDSYKSDRMENASIG